MRRDGLTALTAALAVLVTTGSAHGSPQSVITLTIECPGLGDDGRALLEARARAEAAYESLGGGSIVMACHGSSATVTWLPASAEPRVGTVALGADRAGAVDALLDGLHALLAAARAPGTSPPAVAPTPATPAAPPTMFADPDVPRERVSGSEPTEGVRLGGVAGADTELWSGGIPAAVGLHAGVRLAWAREWSANVVVAPEWGVGSADGLRAWSVEAVARVDHALVGPFRFGLGATARLLWARAASPLSPSKQQATTAGGLLALDYDAQLGSVHLEAGPRLEVLARPIVVQVGGTEAFRVPSFVAGLSAGVRAP